MKNHNLENSNQGNVVATSFAAAKGEHRQIVSSIAIDKAGVVGDVHVGLSGHRQVSLVPITCIEDFKQRTGQQVAHGFFSENITFGGINVKQLVVFDKLQINDVVLEITQKGEKCHGAVCDIYSKLGGTCLKSEQGLFARVVKPGKITVGDKITHAPRIFKIKIITLSDRASAGTYEDKSGEVAQQMLTQFFADKEWQCDFERILLADEPAPLLQNLRHAVQEKVDFIFTLGGTGVGARDITPETVTKVCDKFLPGVMEHIRLKYGAKHPAALLSRSVAGVAGATQIYALPGSVRAVSEYLTEIFQVLEHVLLMLGGIDKHV